jgi:hypothetical protein
MTQGHAQAAPQPVVEPSAQDIVLPTPRPPVLEPAAQDIARPAPRTPDREAAAQDIARPAPRPAHRSRAGWILATVVAAAAAWAAGWVTGVFWAWRAMSPWYLRRTRRRPGAGRPGAASPLRS